MSKIVRLTESDLIKIVKRIINEGAIVMVGPKRAAELIAKEPNATAKVTIEDEGVRFIQSDGSKFGLNCDAIEEPKVSDSSQKLTESEVNRLVRKIIGEGAVLSVGLQKLKEYINGAPNKTADVTVEGGSLLFHFTTGKVFLDCTIKN